MLRTTRRGTHRAEGPAVISYRGLVAPLSKGATGVAAATAVAATGVAGLQASPAEATTAPTAPVPPPTTVTADLAAIAPQNIVPAALGSTTIRQGHRGQNVSALQTLLNANGARINVDGIFGSATYRAVVNFQSSRGLGVDGIVGPQTRNALSSGSSAPAPQASAPAAPSSGTPTVRQGSRGGAVSSLQTLLNQRGASLRVDGIFGRGTNSAVRSFQSSAGLTADGIAGPKTWSALQGGSSASAAPAAPSAPAPSQSSGFNGASIVALAEAQVNKPYAWGSSNPNVGFDCSGLVKHVYESHGISVPRTARQQAFAGRFIPKSEAQPGDLVVFTANNYGHIGIYAGGNTIIDASGGRQQVLKRTIWDSNALFVTYR
ncbi:MAG: peptidoglycan-binding protein [Dermabacter sp.]|nr:peptidoglycan-binding protein [Dermabacter sp.]